MIRTQFARALGLAALAALALAAPAQATDLFDTSVTSAEAGKRVCHARPAEGAAGVAVKRVTAPVRGTLRAELSAASGDWDLGVFDARTGDYVAGAGGPGPAEVASGPVTEGQALIVQACRRSGTPRTASLSAQVVPAPPPSGGTAKLVRVSTPTRASKRKLQDLGLDVTEHGRDTFLDVVTYGAADEAKLRGAGFQYAVEVPDLARQDLRQKRADRAYAAAVDDSPFPSGRTGYRNLADYESEMKALAEKNPRLVRLFELPNKTYEGRTVKGVEITEDVTVRDGKPVFLQMGVHHAREWPSGEHAMEWAYEMVNGYNAGNARAKGIVQNARMIVIPIVNADGFNFSRGTGAQPAPETGGPRPDLSDPTPAYKRKNCNFLDSKQANCQPRQTGVDPNRNYGGFWGGPGAGTNQSDETYRGAAPFSEPESQNVRELIAHRQVTTLITNHTFSNLVLRPPGIAAQGPPPDEPIYKDLGDRMAFHNKYTSEPSYGLYDTTGTTEDWSYYATGGLGFTFEIGSTEFHPAYEQVVKEWNGATARAQAGASGQEGGNKEAYYLAAENSLDDKRHGILTGDAPGGAVLRLKKTFQTPTSQTKEDGSPVTFEDKLDSTYRVPDSGKVDWHVNPSTRPLAAGKPGIGPFGTAGPSAPQTFGPDPANPKVPCGAADTSNPACVDDHEVVVEGLPKDNGSVTFRIEWTEPATDYDMLIFKKQADGSLKQIGSSGQGTTTFEQYTQLAPEPGTYVVRVVYFAAIGTAEPYAGKVTFEASKPGTAGVKEQYDLTCEDPEGQVRESKQVEVDRGQKVDIGKLDCVRPRGSADSRKKPVLKQKAAVRKLSRRRFRLSVKGTLVNVADRACGGVVSVDVKVKTRRAILRRVRVKRDCTYKKKLTFSQTRIPRKLRARRKQAFRVVGRYAGTPSLKPTRVITKTRAKR